MIQLILNNKGTILSTNCNFFKNHTSLFDLGFNENSLNIAVNSSEILLINILEKNYIIKNLKLNLNDIDLIHLIFEEYRSVYIDFEQKEADNELYLIDNYDLIEQSIIFAVRNFYLQDKDILYFLKNLTGRMPDYHKLQYIMKKLYLRFGVLNRSELLRKIYFYNLNTFFPKNIFKPGLYKFNYEPLQIL